MAEEDVMVKENLSEEEQKHIQTVVENKQKMALSLHMSKAKYRWLKVLFYPQRTHQNANLQKGENLDKKKSSLSENFRFCLYNFVTVNS